ncbi:MAG: O-antigen ligase family protein [Cyanobacteria bacterium P01_F01_bin.116]
MNEKHMNAWAQVFLFACLGLAFNPWAATRGEIYTDPKIMTCVVITIYNLSFIRFIPGIWRLLRLLSLLWVPWLAAGTLATIHAPVPFVSVFGNSIYRVGLVWWAIMALFSIVNALALYSAPSLAKHQMKGLLIAGAVNACIMIGQTIDPSLDLVVGGLWESATRLSSGVMISHQPIGIFSHRNYAGAFLAFTAVSLHTFRRQGYFRERPYWIVLALLILGVVLSGSRSALLAIAVGGFLVNQRFDRKTIALSLAALCIVGFITVGKKVHDLPQVERTQIETIVRNTTSDRVYLWKRAIRHIKQSPVIGYGFNGFQVANKTDQHQITQMSAYNIVLNVLVDTGFNGLFAYLFLIAGSLYLCRSSGFSVIPYSYLMWLLMWFDNAQFSTFFWWSLSVGMAMNFVERYAANHFPIVKYSLK